MRHTLTIFFTICTCICYGQDKWSLEKCISYALENNLTIKTNELNIKSSQESLTLAEHARYPNLNASLSHGVNLGRSIDPFTNAFISQEIQSSNFSINGNVTLYNGLQLKNTILQSQLNIQASEQDLAQSKNLITLNLINGYMNILFGIENLSNAQRQVANLDEQIERTQKLVDAGVLPRTNLLDLQSQKATNELQLVQAENALALSKLQLRQILQLPPDQSFDIIVPELPEPEANVIFDDPNTIYSVAEGTQPDVKSADIQAKSAELGIDIAKADYQPNVAFTYSGSTNFSSAQQERVVGIDDTNTIITTSPNSFVTDESGNNFFINTVSGVPIFEDFGFFTQLYESRRGFVGISVSVPIYNRNQVKSRVANAVIQRDRARLNAQTIRNNLRQTIEQAYQDAVAAAKTYDANKKQVEALEETFRMTQERFNLGVSNITDFNVAQNNLNVAKSNLIRGKYDFILRTKVLDFYMGKELKF